MSDDVQEDFFSSQTQASSREHQPSLFFGDDDDDDHDEDERAAGGQAPGWGQTGTKRIAANGDTASEPSKRSRGSSSEVLRTEKRSSPDGTALGQWDKRFIGTFIIPAWSLSKGANYVQQGDKVRILRQKPKTSNQKTHSKPQKGSMGGAKKQAKLNFTAAPSKKPKVKEDYVVRFSNMSGECTSCHPLPASCPHRIGTQASKWAVSQAMSRPGCRD